MKWFDKTEEQKEKKKKEKYKTVCCVHLIDQQHRHATADLTTLPTISPTAPMKGGFIMLK